MFRWLFKNLVRMAVLLVLLMAVLAGATFLTAPMSDVAIFTAPGRAAETAVEAGGSVVETSSLMAIARSSEPGYIPRLYSAGAFLVIDARAVMVWRATMRWAGEMVERSPSLR